MENEMTNECRVAFTYCRMSLPVTNLDDSVGRGYFGDDDNDTADVIQTCNPP